MVPLSDLVGAVPPSPTLAASERAQALKAAGKDIISLTVGEPDFDTPDHIKRAAIAALEKNHTRYTAVQGILPLRETIVQKFKREQGIGYTPKDIIVTNGGKQALGAAFAALLNPGDEVIIPAPYWTSYPDMVRLVGGVPVIVQTTAAQGYRMTAEQLLAASTPRTRVVVINSPSNPTGACYSGADLRELALAVLSLKNKEQVTIISDDVYEYITFDGFEHQSLLTVAPEVRDNTLIVNAFSKAYAMTGWRVGYAAGPRHVIDAMSVHQSQFTSNVCSIAQHAAVSAYDDGYAFPKMMKQEFQKRLDVVWEAVQRMPGISLSVKPRGAFYAFLEVDGLIGKSAGGTTIKSGDDFAQYLLEKFDVVMVQGSAFGAPNAVRMSFALAPKVLETALSRITEAASQLS